MAFILGIPIPLVEPFALLIDRLRTSAILLSVVGLLLYADANHSVAGAEGLWLLPLLFFFALGTAHDVAKLVGISGHKVARSDAMIGAGMITASAVVPIVWPIFGGVYPAGDAIGRLGWIVVGAVAAVFLILVREMRRFVKHQSFAGKPGTIERTCGSVFVSMYVGLPMAMLVGLRTLGSGNWGLAALITMIAVTKSTDAGAYFTGKSLGRNKLVPRLSPGKTREGAAGGIATATIVAFACLQWLFPAIAGADPGPVLSLPFDRLGDPIVGALLLGPLLAIAGMIGDLAESLIKRDSGAKDSGSLLPGLGGVWDVTDSLIAAIVPAYVCFAVGVGG